MNNIVVVTEGLEAIPLAWLKLHADVHEVSYKDRAALTAALSVAAGLIVRTYTRVNTELLAAAPKLKVVGRAGVGLENIDQNACAQRGIKVLSTPEANTHAVVEYVFNLIFTLTRPVVNLSTPISAEEFHHYRKTSRGLELYGKTLGILGMGRIGRAVGRVAHALGMKVIYNDILDVSKHIDFPAQSVIKPELYRRSDILTLHVSHRPGNAGMINGETFKLLPSHAILVNTARGEIIDAQALAEALKTGKIGGAALDVHAPEPPGPDYPLWGLSNLILVPHLAARTQGAMDAMSWVARAVVDYLNATTT
ncbi:MAG: 3-phosphoglycerate dehydrogenase [Planctomycetes bacterium]|nr:3-phosphoglycerate dehydrogenase [Planctomycetota bacterium]